MLMLREAKLRDLRAAQSADRAASTDLDAANEAVTRAASALEILPLTGFNPALRGVLHDVQSARLSTLAAQITLEKAMTARAKEIAALNNGAAQ